MLQNRTVTVTMSYRQPDKPVIKEKKYPQKSQRKKQKFKKKVIKPEKIKPPLEKTPKSEQFEPEPESELEISEPEAPVLESEEDEQQLFEDNRTDTLASDKIPSGTGTIGDSVLSVQTERVVYPLGKYTPDPKYPRLANRRGLQGSVILSMLVVMDGTVKDVQVLKSSGHRSLDRAAIDGAKKWLFYPGQKGKQKVEMWKSMQITFELQ